MARVVLDSVLASLYEEREQAREEFERLDRELRSSLAGTCRLTRQRKGMTQEAIGDELGCSNVVIHQLESNKPHRVSLDKAEKILRVLGVRFR